MHVGWGVRRLEQQSKSEWEDTGESCLPLRTSFAKNAKAWPSIRQDSGVSAVLWKDSWQPRGHSTGQLGEGSSGRVL